ncbi:gp256 [Bacillus phage G]|uniref:Gp256 n=1 Tax=Bacillus phage G TaxID=2884420 RepID=G3M9Z7_9CAUD|nr:gp256 [Bacillus phage G]AEO93515.1 gp256 [Bacillus phage G]
MSNEKQLWLSHSRMSAYYNCPLYYKLTYIDKVQLDTKGNYHTALGNGIHKVLEDMYSTNNYSLKFMENLWEVVCHKGYTEKNGQHVKAILHDEQYDFPNGEEEKNMFFYHGRKLIREYYHKNKHEFGVGEIVATELNFKVPVGGGKVVLNGYIDKILRLPNGKLVVCDYKTGKENTQEEVDDNYQLTLYAFAVRKLFEEVEGELYLHFIKSGNKVKTTRGKEDFDKLLDRVKFVKNGIETEQFEPKIGEQCRYCLHDCPLNGNGLQKDSE